MKNEYFMGIDPYRTEDNTESVCIISRGEDNNGALVATYTGRNDIDFEKEMEKLIAFYKP